MTDQKPDRPNDEATAALNTDWEIYREGAGDFYADSIHVTAAGGIGINCGGTVIVKSLQEWHRLATPSPTRDGAEGEYQRGFKAVFESAREQYTSEAKFAASAPPKPAPDAMREVFTTRIAVRAVAIAGKIVEAYQKSARPEDWSPFLSEMRDLLAAPVPPADGAEKVAKILNARATDYRRQGGKLFTGWAVAEDFDTNAETIRALSPQAPHSSSEGDS